MITLNPGQSVILTDTATYKDAQGNVFVDVAAKITWEDVTGGGAVTLTDQGTNAGVGTCKVDYLAAGSASILATSTDSDGNVNASGLNNPDAITCSPAVTNTDASANNITEGIPTP